MLLDMAIDNYRAQSMDALKLFFPELRMDELAKAIDWSIVNNAKDNPSEIYNDYKDIKVNTTVFRMTQYILSKQPIVTAHGVIFQNHNSGILNPLSLQLKNYFVNRKILKKTMFTYEPGTELYERYNLAQLLKKLSMNSVWRKLSRTSGKQFSDKQYVNCWEVLKTLCLYGAKAETS